MVGQERITVRNQNLAHRKSQALRSCATDLEKYRVSEQHLLEDRGPSHQPGPIPFAIEPPRIGDIRRLNVLVPVDRIFSRAFGHDSVDKAAGPGLQSSDMSARQLGGPLEKPAPILAWRILTRDLPANLTAVAPRISALTEAKRPTVTGGPP